MRLKNILLINRAPFEHLELDFGDENINILSGINGAGKTTIISYIVDAFYELAKCQFVFKMSQGMETELLSQALDRLHYSYVSNPEFARAVTLKSGILITLSVIVIVVVCAFALYLFFYSIRKRSAIFLKTSACQGELVATICILCTLIPIVVALFRSKYAFSLESLLEILFPFLIQHME